MNLSKLFKHGTVIDLHKHINTEYAHNVSELWAAQSKETNPIADGALMIYNPEWKPETEIPEWLKSGENYSGDSLDLPKYEKKAGVTCAGMVFISEIIKQVVAEDKDIIILTLKPDMTFVDDSYNFVMSLTKAICKILDRVFEYTSVTLDAFSDVFGNLDDRCVFIINSSASKEKLDAFWADARSIVAANEDQEWNDALKAHFIGRLASANKRVETSRALISAFPRIDDPLTDINLNAIKIRKTTCAPENFAIKLLAKYGVLFDTNAVTPGTMLVNPRDVLKYIPKFCGSLKSRYDIINAAVQYCLTVPNKLPSKSSKAYYGRDTTCEWAKLMVKALKSAVEAAKPEG